MTTGLRAIETVYNGYRFRSRSEARWAFFMDQVGVKWTYEDEGYELDGIRYLPDFYLPNQEAWLEVKGARPDPRSIDMEKARRLAAASERVVFVISGDIDLEYTIDAFGKNRYGHWRWCVCLRCRSAGITNRGNGAALPCTCFQDDEFYVSDNWKIIRDALLAARQERFGT